MAAARVQGPKPKHVPLRRCVVCRASSPKATLLRLVRDADGSFKLDPGSVAGGRGAYVCRTCAAEPNEKRLRQAFRSQAAQVSALLTAVQAVAGQSNDSGIRTEA